MKRIIACVFALTCLVFADQGFLDKVSAYVAQKTGEKINAIKSLDLKSSPNLKFVILKHEQDSANIPVFATKDAQIVLGLSNILILSDEDLKLIENTYKEIETSKETHEEIDKFFATIRQLRDYIDTGMGKTIKITENNPLKSSKDLNLIVLEDTQNQAKLPAFKAGEHAIIGLSNIFIPADSQDRVLVEDVYKKVNGIKAPDPKVLDRFFSSLKQTRYITLKSESKNPKKTFYIVSDPRCPACRKELAEVEKKLKEGDVKILLVAFLGEESANKASLIYEKLIGVKDNAKILKTMREIYDPNYVLTPKDKKLSIKDVMQNNEDVAKAKIQSVPFEHIINK